MFFGIQHTHQYNLNYLSNDNEETARPSEIFYQNLKKTARQNPLWICQNIHLLEIDDEFDLFEIAKEIARLDGQLLIENFTNFSIKKPSYISCLAKISLKQNPWEVSANLSCLPLTNQDYMDIFDYLEKVSTGAITMNIHRWDVPDLNIYLGLIHRATVLSPKDILNNIEAFQRLKTYHKTILIKKIIHLTGHPSQWGIKNKETFLHFAKKMIAGAPLMMIPDIETFSVLNTDEKILLMEFAIDKASYVDQSDLLDYLIVCEIKDRELYKALFILTAKYTTCSFFISTLISIKFKDLEILKAIALFLAESHPAYLSNIIQEFQLSDDEDLYSIARKAIFHHSGSIALINNYNIQSPLLRFKLVCYSLSLYPQLTKESWQLFKLEPLAGFGSEKEIILYDLLMKLFKNICDLSLYTQCLDMLSFYEIETAAYRSRDHLDQKVHLSTLRTQCEWILYVICSLNECHISKSDLEWIKKHQLFETIFELHSPLKRFQLSNIIFTRLCGDEDLKNIYDQLQPVGSYVHCRLPNILLCSLINHKFSRSSIQNISKEFQKHVYREAPIFHILMDYLTLISLKKEKLTHEDLGYLLSLIDIPSKDSKESFKKNIGVLLALGEYDHTKIKKKHLLDYHSDFEKLLFDVVSEVLPLKHIQNFSEKFAKTFGKDRNPSSILIYASKLCTIPHDNRYVLLLSNFIDWVIHNRFHEERYDHSVHLLRVFSGREKLRAEWKAGDSRYIHNLQLKECPLPTEPLDDLMIVDTDNPCDLLNCGNDVPGSCFNVDHEAKYSKWLLPILLDGKNRLLAIKRISTGKIIARTIFKLLWDDHYSKPVLFQDTTYPRKAHAFYVAVLHEMARRRANALKLDLVGGGGIPLDKYPSSIQSLGGIAPEEYVDALDCSYPNSAFTLKKRTTAPLDL